MLGKKSVIFITNILALCFVIETFRHEVHCALVKRDTASERSRKLKYGCKLPDQPNNGQYVNLNDQSAQLTSKQTVPAGTTLLYQCNNNYKLRPVNTTITCERRKWRPQIPTCIVSLRRGNCHRSDQNLDRCLLADLRRMLPNIVHGVSDVDIPSLDPLNADFFTHADGHMAGIINMNVHLTDAEFRGYRNTEFRSISLNPNTLKGQVRFYIRQLEMLTTYSSYGNILLLPVDSNAKARGVFDNLDFTLNFELRIIQHNGEEYFTMDSATLHCSIGNAKLTLTSIKAHDQGKDNLVQDTFNVHQQLILNSLKSDIEREGAEFYKDLIERYLSVIPVEELLPE